MEKAKYITVFDYDNADVSTYPLDIWEIENEDIESTLINLGHKTENCKWMIHQNKPIIH
tara:strand:- start:125 stop:301 length:177 start_codon:yes stop_codon:yes gene_type:complete